MYAQKKLWLKIGAILGLIILLQVPLAWVGGAVNERRAYQEDAAEDIAGSWSYEQTLTGPFVVVPYQTHYRKQVWDKNLEAYTTHTFKESHKAILVADNSAIKGNVDVERRFRGIYNTPVYTSQLRYQGEVNLSRIDDIKKREGFAGMGQPYLVMFINDLRGISDIPLLSYNNKTSTFTEGNGMNVERSGIHALLDVSDDKHINYEFSLRLKGSNGLNFYPVGKGNTVEISSSWLHPKFVGKFLPDAYTINSEGFSVVWKVNSLSSNLMSLVNACEHGKCEGLLASSFGVNFIEPVSHYRLADRASKYAMLFLLLTFASFFLFEVFKSLAIHPFQYLMVGLALSIFYLLLVALSEHVSFALAYWLSTFACIGLIGMYTSYILKGALRAMFLAGALLLIYTLMFFILRSEDYAFLMGAILFFAILSSVMMITRKFDWYSVGVSLDRTGRNPLSDESIE